MGKKVLIGIVILLILIALGFFIFSKFSLISQRECSADEDCVKASCCHATSCVAREKAPNCSGIACTFDCKPNTLDCGGSCKCTSGKCSASISSP